MHLYIIIILTLVNYDITNYKKHYIDDTKANNSIRGFLSDCITLSCSMRSITDGTPYHAEDLL